MAAREEKKEAAFTARANEICVVLTTQKYDGLMLIISNNVIIVVGIVFVAALAPSVMRADVPGVSLDGPKKRRVLVV